MQSEIVEFFSEIVTVDQVKTYELRILGALDWDTNACTALAIAQHCMTIIQAGITPVMMRAVEDLLAGILNGKASCSCCLMKLIVS